MTLKISFTHIRTIEARDTHLRLLYLLTLFWECNSYGKNSRAKPVYSQHSVSQGVVRLLPTPSVVRKISVFS